MIGSTSLEHAAASASLPKGLWRWIAERDNDFGKQPSIKERCSILLKSLAGKCLKDERKLWQIILRD
jgi:hypothetical protein